MHESGSPEIAAAYAFCRQVAKREAKNFYYAFRVLPKQKSDAMCAVYAFMRKADDLADDESISVQERREKMAAWTDAWKKSLQSPTSDPVFLALKDTQERFSIPSELLEQLVDGTTMDLYGAQAGVEELTVPQAQHSDGTSTTIEIYRSFDDLYRYCYLVASVVGLVCIRIFGYTDHRAEKLAEHVGIAFQLTNILRDVKEDAERGRVYLPNDDLAESHVSPAQLLTAIKTGTAQPDILTLLKKEIARADAYYAAVDELVPLLDPDSRVAMEVLAAIYQNLLRRIADEPTAVLLKRVSVPTSRKLSILLGGLFRAHFHRGQV